MSFPDRFVCLNCVRNWKAACNSVWKRKRWKKILLVRIMTLLKRNCFQNHLLLKKQLQALEAFSCTAVDHCRRKLLNVRMLEDALAWFLVPLLHWTTSRIKVVSLCCTLLKFSNTSLRVLHLRESLQICTIIHSTGVHSYVLKRCHTR